MDTPFRSSLLTFIVAVSLGFMPPATALPQSDLDPSPGRFRIDGPITLQRPPADGEEVLFAPISGNILRLKIPDGKGEGIAELLLEDSAGSRIWSGRAGSNVVLAPDGRSFVAANPFDDHVSLVAPEISNTPVFRGPGFSVRSITCIPAAESFALLGEDSLVILKWTGERSATVGTGAHEGAEVAASRDWSFFALPVHASTESTRNKRSPYDSQYGVRVLDLDGNQVGGIAPHSGWWPQRLAVATDHDTVIVVATDLDLSAWSLSGDLLWRDPVFDTHHLVIDVTMLTDGTIVLITRTPQTDIFETRLYDESGNRLQMLTLPDWLSLGSANSHISELPDGRLFLQGEDAAAFLVRE